MTATVIPFPKRRAKSNAANDNTQPPSSPAAVAKVAELIVAHKNGLNRDEMLDSLAELENKITKEDASALVRFAADVWGVAV